jgi:hypothetical protein
VLLETPARLGELELPLPASESGQKPLSALLVPILVDVTEIEEDWSEPARDEVTEDGASQDGTGANLIQEEDASSHDEGKAVTPQKRRPVGALVLQSPFGTAFEKPVLERIQVLCELIGQAIQQTQALSAHDVQDTDQKIARQIQSELLIQETPVLEDWDIAVRWELSTQARDVGSGFFRLPDRDKFVIVEPHSHGLPAALTGLLVHSLIRANDLEAKMSEAEALEAMNAYLMMTHQPTALLCTTLDRENILTLINAGCASPLWWHSQHKRVEDLRSTGSALGLAADAIYEEKSIALAVDDVLVLCTTSLLDVSDGKETFGQKRLIEALNRFAGGPASALAEAIMAQATAFCARESECLQSLQDDILVAVFRRQGTGSNGLEGFAGQKAVAAQGETTPQGA